MNKPRIKKSKFVCHPRYGDKPHYTDDKYTMEQVLNAYRGYTEEEVILGTCIDANLDKQNFTMSTRELYVDLMRLCEGCGKRFIFYAQEQKYWYEDLGFFIECDCLRCFDCRKNDREIKELVKRYSTLLNKSRSEDEQREYAQIASELYDIGYIKRKSKVPKS